MDRAGRVSAALLVLAAVALPVRAEEGPFVGVDVGVSEPINGNYRGHLRTGAALNPFAGYMFTENLGVQGQLHLDYHNSDLHIARGDGNNNQATSMLGGTIGPRLEVPLGGPFEDLVGLYATGQGGMFTGLSGRLNHSAAGVSLGGGVDFNLTKTIAVGIFGRWNYAFMSPTPGDLGEDQDPRERFARDISWATAGLGVKITFPPEPPPPPPAPAPAVEKKFVLRNVYFDFDRDTLRPDAIPILDTVVSELKEDDEIAVVAEGNADSTGTTKYNLGLSRRRAGHVQKYLVDHGIASTRIRVEAAGESKPIASNATPEGRAKIRRVEIRVV